MKQNKLGIKKILLLLVTCYLFLAVAFYYLAGCQLHYRQSRGNLEMATAQTGVAALEALSFIAFGALKRSGKEWSY